MRRKALWDSLVWVVGTIVVVGVAVSILGTAVEAWLFL